MIVVGRDATGAAIVWHIGTDGHGTRTPAPTLPNEATIRRVIVDDDHIIVLAGDDLSSSLWQAGIGGTFAQIGSVPGNASDVVRSDGAWVAVGGVGQVGGTIWRSENGRDWTVVNEANDWSSWFSQIVAGSNSTLVAAGAGHEHGIGRIDMSNNGGRTWQRSDLSRLSCSLAATIAYSNHTFVAVRGNNASGGTGAPPTQPAIAYWSDDGAHWNFARADGVLTGPSNGCSSSAGIAVATSERFAAIFNPHPAIVPAKDAPLSPVDVITSSDGQNWTNLASASDADDIGPTSAMFVLDSISDHLVLIGADDDGLAVWSESQRVPHPDSRTRTAQNPL